MAEGLITRRGGNATYGTFSVPGTGDSWINYITISELAGKKHWFLMLDHDGGGKSNNGVHKFDHSTIATVLGLYYNDGVLLCYYELNGIDYISNETPIKINSDGKIYAPSSGDSFYFSAMHTFTYVAW